MSKRNPKFCLVPFISFSVSPRGAIKSCCLQNDLNIKDWYNIKDIDPEVKWPTENIKTMRRKFLEPDPESNIPECGACWNAEKQGLSSYRTTFNDYYFGTRSKETIDKLIVDPELQVLDLQFGHLCNLSCVMCYSNVSSHLHSTKIKLASITDSIEQKSFYEKETNNIPKEMNLDWTKDEFTYNKVKKLSESITEIKISGGEPLFNPKFKDFLTYLLTKEKPLRRIHLTTNGTIYDQEIMDMLNNIDIVTLKISLESVGDEDEFLRWPGKWSDKEENINKFLENIKDDKEIILSSCIQSLNIFSLQKTADFINQMKKKYPNKNIILNRQLISNIGISALGHCDLEYLQHFLETSEGLNGFDDVKNIIRDSLLITDRKISQQVLYYKDMSILSGLSLEKLFPVYWHYHKKYV